MSAFASRWAQMQKLPFAKDRSIPKDSATKGILYAFTLGMAPWSKESTRIHMLAYLRGIAFHVGIFAGLAAFLASPWFESIPLIVRVVFAMLTGFGAVMGVAGALMRVVEHNLRAISTPDDHASVWLVTIFLAAMTIALGADRVRSRDVGDRRGDVRVRAARQDQTLHLLLFRAIVLRHSHRTARHRRRIARTRDSNSR